MRLNGNKKNKTIKLIMDVGDGGRDELTKTRPQTFYC